LIKKRARTKQILVLAEGLTTAWRKVIPKFYIITLMY